MNPLKNIYRLINNFAVFLGELSRYDRFYWRGSSCITANCDLDETVVLHGSYALSNVGIGFASYVSHNAQIANTTIGKFCSIGPNIVCGWGIHPTNGISTHPAFYSSKKKSAITYSETDKAIEHRPIIIGNDVFIGANVTILDGVIIENGAVIGAGSVVSKNIPPYAIAVGCPIRILRFRFSKDIINGLQNTQWWNNEVLYSKVKEDFFSVEKFLSNKN